MQGGKKDEKQSSLRKAKPDSDKNIWEQKQMQSSSQREFQCQHRKGNVARKSSNGRLKTRDSRKTLREIPICFCTPQYDRL